MSSNIVKIREIPEMRERLAKGCATDCSGECGDCTRFGTPMEIKGRLFLAEGEGVLPTELCEEATSLYVIFAYDADGKWLEIASEVQASIGEKLTVFVGSSTEDAEDMTRASKNLNPAGCFTVSEGSRLSRLGDLKDTENIILDPASCVAFEGVRYAMAGGPHFETPDDNSVIIVWAANPVDLDFEGFLVYYEKSKRL